MKSKLVVGVVNFNNLAPAFLSRSLTHAVPGDQTKILLNTKKKKDLECVWYCGSCCGCGLKKIVFIKSTFS
jgi:hypothetical protein